MRTLKKALCLVLVLSMVMGIGVIGAGAAYSDADQIEYQEAVDVMTAIGVMQGVGENTFDPDGTFTRAQAAKMLAYMILGETAAESLPARGDFTDVSADQWFSKYIGYGVQEGYLAGMGDGSFKPDDPVTGYQWAKMLLCALGYDPKAEGLEGNGYEINVAKLVLTDVKLFEGNLGQDYNQPATREEAALYAFNTLKQDMVKYSSTSTVTINGVEVVISQGEPEKVPQGDNKGIDDDSYMQFGEKYFPELEQIAEATTADAFGRSAVKWEYDNDEIGTYAASPELTYTDEVTGGKIYTDMGRTKSTSVKYIVDGADQSYGTADAIKSGNSTKFGGPGAVTEVYEDEGVYTIVTINTYIGSIATHEDAKTDDDGAITDKEYVTIAGDDVTPGTLDNSGKFETTAFSEDDEPVDGEITTYVLYTAAKNADDTDYTVQSAVAVTPTTVTVSSVTAGKSFIADGNTYTFGAKYVGDVAYSSATDAKNTYEIYADSYGYILKGIATSEDTVTGYAIVTAVSDGGAAWSDASNTYQAKIIGADGQEQVVDINEASYNAYGSSNRLPALVKYSIDDGKYVFNTTIQKIDSNSADEAFKVTAGVSAVIFSDGDSTPVTDTTAVTKYANSETIFFIGTTDDDDKVTYEVVTGIANMSSIEYADADTKVVYLDTDNVLNAVLVMDAKDSDSSSTVADIAFLVYDANAPETTDATGTYKTYDAVIGGNITTVKIDSDSVETIFENSENVVAAKLTYNDKGLVTGADKTNFGDDVGVLDDQAVTTAVKNGVVTLATDGTYSVANDCNVYVLKDGALTAGSTADMKVDAKYTVTCVTVKDIITTVYVTVAD